MKKILIIFGLFFVFSSTAFAQGILLINSDILESDNHLMLDADDTGGDIELQFGNTLDKHLQWNNAGSYFEFNDDLSLAGNELKNFRIDNLASAPTCDASAKGREYHNTSNTFTYVCDGSSWKQLDSTGGDPSSSSANTFILDSDDTGGDVTLQFGSTLAEYIQWNDTAQAFIVSDDLLLNFNELKQFKIENSATALTCNGTYTGRAYHNTTDTFTYVCDGTSWKQIDAAGGGGGADVKSGVCPAATCTHATLTTITFNTPFTSTPNISVSLGGIPGGAQIKDFHVEQITTSSFKVIYVFKSAANVDIYWIATDAGNP